MTFGDRALSISVVYDHIVSTYMVWNAQARKYKTCSKELMKDI